MTERRERYENALINHPVHDNDTLRYAVDAVMALANEESVELTEAYVAARSEVGRSYRAVGRLSAENARLRATIERVRNALDDTTGTHADAVERAYEALNGPNGETL